MRDKLHRLWIVGGGEVEGAELFPGEAGSYVAG